MTDTRKPVALMIPGEFLQQIYMCGMASGVATAALTFGLPEAAADALSDAVCGGIDGDRLAVEEIRNQIREILTGTDSGSFTFQVGTPIQGDGRDDHS